MKNKKKIDDEILFKVFIKALSPEIIEITKREIKAHGFEIVEVEGQSLDTFLTICEGNSDQKFKLFLRKLILEVASKDVTEKTPRFDRDLINYGYFTNPFQNLVNHDYYLNKIGLIIQSKLKIINSIRNLSGEEEIRTNLETLVSEGEYERIQLQKLDENRTNLENKR